MSEPYDVSQLSDDECARILFDYGCVQDALMPASAIVAFGNHDEHVARHAAQLYLKGYAPVILFTGGYGRITKSLWQEPEAVRFARIAEAAGVPREHILVEPNASNTGENIAQSRKLLAEHDVDMRHLIMVDRPYRCERTKLALQVQWPETAFMMSAPELDYEAYVAWYDTDGPISKTGFISLMVGDLQRNLVYGQQGMQAEATVDERTMAAYHELIRRGYVSQMIKN